MHGNPWTDLIDEIYDRESICTHTFSRSISHFSDRYEITTAWQDRSRTTSIDHPCCLDPYSCMLHRHGTIKKGSMTCIMLADFYCFLSLMKRLSITSGSTISYLAITASSWQGWNCTITRKCAAGRPSMHMHKCEQIKRRASSDAKEIRWVPSIRRAQR